MKLNRKYVTNNLTQSYDPWAEASMNANNPGYSGASWMLYILPFMEHNEIFDHWNLTRTVMANKAVAQSDIKEFYCPSRRSTVQPGDATIMFQNWTSGGTDYGGCVGRVNFWDNVMSPSNTGTHQICAAEYIVPNAANNQPLVPMKIGVFFPNSQTTLNQVTDGASHTIMVGELQRLHNPGACPRRPGLRSTTVPA